MSLDPNNFKQFFAAFPEKMHFSILKVTIKGQKILQKYVFKDINNLEIYVDFTRDVPKNEFAGYYENLKDGYQISTQISYCSPLLNI